MFDPKFPEESQSLEEDGLILQIWQYRILLKKIQWIKKGLNLVNI